MYFDYHHLVKLLLPQLVPRAEEKVPRILVESQTSADFFQKSLATQPQELIDRAPAMSWSPQHLQEATGFLY